MEVLNGYSCGDNEELDKSDGVCSGDAVKTEDRPGSFAESAENSILRCQSANAPVKYLKCKGIYTLG